MTRKKLEKIMTAACCGRKREAQKIIAGIRRFLAKDASNVDVLYRFWVLTYNLARETGEKELQGEIRRELAFMLGKYGPAVGGRMRDETEGTDGDSAEI